MKFRQIKTTGHSKRTTTKIASVLSAAVLAASLFTGCGSTDSETAPGDASSALASSESESLTIRVAVQKSTYSPYLTQALGYFEDAFSENNVTVELTEFSQGAPMIEAVNSDEIDIAFLGDTPVFAGLVNGGDYSIIGKYSQDTAKALLVRKDAGIQSFSDLKGHTYATPFGSNVQPLAEIYLKEGGLSTADVEYTNLTFSDINTSLANGDIDAAVTNEPNISKILASTDEVEVLATAEGYKTFIGPIVARNSFLDSHSHETSEFLAALQKAADWSKENPEEAIEKIAAEAGLETADVKALFEQQDNNVTLTAEQIEELQQSANDAYASGLLTAELAVSKYIDTSYLEAAGISEK